MNLLLVISLIALHVSGQPEEGLTSKSKTRRARRPSDSNAAVHSAEVEGAIAEEVVIDQLISKKEQELRGSIRANRAVTTVSPVGHAASVANRWHESIVHLMNTLNLHPIEGVELSVKRNAALFDSLELLNGSVDRLRGGLRTVVFSGERAYGSGAVRDWFTEVTHQLVDPSLHLFKLSPDKPHYLMINPQSERENPMYRDLYKATGRLMAFALISNQLVGLNFPVMFYAALLGLEIDLEDIKEDEPVLYESYSFVLNDIETADGYSIDIHDVEHPITTENKNEMIRKKVNSLIPQESRDFINLIRSGFNDVLTIAVVRAHFNAKQLKDLIVGRAKINIEELVTAVDYSESRYNSDSTQIKWLWDVLRTVDQEKRRAFIHFVTGSTQIPSGGFSRMPRRINIKPLEPKDALPRASNCFNTLYLPRYESKDILKKKLFKALELSNEMEDA